MKKKITYIADEEEVDVYVFIKSLLREKILILSISIICGLAGYLFSYFQTNIDRLVKNGSFKARYMVDGIDKVNNSKTGVDIAYDINAGSSKQKYGDTTGGYKTSVSRVDDFVDSITDFVTTNPIKTGLGVVIALLGAGYYFLSKGGFTKVVG